jgi:hypothetical protein
MSKNNGFIKTTLVASMYNSAKQQERPLHKQKIKLAPCSFNDKISQTETAPLVRVATTGT